MFLHELSEAVNFQRITGHEVPVEASFPPQRDTSVSRKFTAERLFVK